MSQHSERIQVMAVATMALIAMVGLVGLIALACSRIEPPPGLSTVTGMSLGFLGGFLAPNGQRNGNNGNKHFSAQSNGSLGGKPPGP